MANPTYDEVRANPAYASVPDEQLKQAYAAKFPQPQAPTLMQRVKDFATNPTVLKTVGATAGLALAPEATIPAMLLAGAGSMGGGLASSIARDKAESAGDMGLDFAEGAVGPVIGKGLQGGAAVLRAAGKVLPKNILYGALAGPKGLGTMAALRAATAESGLPRVLDWAGENYNKVINAVRGSLRPAEAEAEAAVDPVVARTRAMVNKVAGKSVEQPYKMPTGVSEPYQPRGFRSAMDSLKAEPGPVQPEVVESAAPVEQARPSMADVESLTDGINSKVPMSKARLAELAQPQQASSAMASLRQATGGGSGAPAKLLPFSSSYPFPGWGSMVGRDVLGTEGLPQEFEQAIEQAGPHVTKVPMGQSGSEYVSPEGGKIQPYGPSTELTPEEQAAVPEFWDRLMQLYSTQR